eukprot:TRINITY_DN1863_c0_g3_i2.p1 TRINITY_DN1863_c0_g3~~TRINITY_DN1863_c0_g3_i2.p1  ORF type:complete len:1110 (+),score=260.04 TRINITY_DN1863_c0_g3_i2:371-3331(+)
MIESHVLHKSSVYLQCLIYVEAAEGAWERNGSLFTQFLNKVRDTTGSVILSCSPEGYQTLISKSPAVTDLFPFTIRFDDYNDEQLKMICKQTVERHGFLMEESYDFIDWVLKKYPEAERRKRNGHIANEIAMKAIYNKFVALASPIEPQTAYITKEDFSVPASSRPEKENVAKLLEELENLIGLEKVKSFVKNLEAQAATMRERRKHGLSNEKGENFHMAFIGNPGTGKTTVAKIIAKILYSLDFLSNGHTIEAQKSDFVGSYVNQISGRTKELVKSATGGVLFIDDAYSLSEGGESDSSGEMALTTLVGMLDSDKNDFVAIFAGYPKDMEKLLSTNAGLKSRVSLKVYFDDYTKPELFEIAKKIVQKENYILSPDAEQKLQSMINILDTSGNARSMKNLVAKIIMKQSFRTSKLSTPSKEELMKIETEDLEEEQGGGKTPEQIFRELDSMVGLQKVKDFVKQIHNQVLLDKERTKLGLISSGEPEPLHMIFKGNPGTGKSTVASMIASIFKHLGRLSSGHLITARREDFVGSYLGQTEKRTAELINTALGGVLFIDEAYHFAGEENDTYGRIALTTLIHSMELHRHDLVVIMAGYPREMARLMQVNPGLPSRFPHVVSFDDYSAEELIQIGTKMFEKSRYVLTEQALTHFTTITKNSGLSGNARNVRNLVGKVIRYQNTRVLKIPERTIDDLQKIEVADFCEGQGDLLPREESRLLLNELDAFIGLSEVKEYIHKLHDSMIVRNARREHALTQADMGSLHMVFKGASGTGKTMVSNLIARLLYSLKLIPTPQLTVAKRDDLVGKWLGHTESKAREFITGAIGGVLFIDEAYHLLADQWGTLALTVLLDMMDLHRHELVVIIAGYPKEMESLIESNPGLRSRFNRTLMFKPYSGKELSEITMKMFTKESYNLDEEAKESLLTITNGLEGNAREARNLVGKTILNHNSRVAKIENPDLETLMTIKKEDFGELLETSQKSQDLSKWIL